MVLLIVAVLLSIAGATAPAPSASTSTPATYYVSNAGRDSRTCGEAQSESAPKQSIAGGLSCLAAGDTLLLRGGTYNEAINNNVPSGTSWTSEVRVAAYPGEHVLVSPETGVGNGYVIDLSQNQHYIELDGLNLDASKQPYAAVHIETQSLALNPHHIRVQNAELIGNPKEPSFGVIVVNAVSGAVGANEFINLAIHGGGRNDFNHGIYLQASDDVVDHCVIYDWPGAGIQVENNYNVPPNNIVLRNNTIHHLRATAPGQRHWGVIVAGNATNTLIANNIIYTVPDEGASSSGIDVYQGIDTKIYNNTVSGAGAQGIALEAASVRSAVVNNISGGHRQDFVDGGAQTSTASNLFAIDPLFVNASAGDFDVQPRSAAVDHGTALGAVPTDIAGRPRPQNGAYDIGAHEATAQAPDSASIATYHLGVGWATFGLAMPQGASSDGVRVGDIPTQTDVKTTWPDGSIRFAVVTAKADVEGDYVITAHATDTGTFSPAWPNEAVTFNIGGTSYTATARNIATGDAWLSGPLVQERRVVVSPATATGAAHPLLQVVFDVRVYKDGVNRVDLAVQNVKDIAAVDLVKYTVGIAVGGAPAWSQANVTHWWGTRWRQTFWSRPPADVVPDFEPFYRANALPRFLPTIEQGTYDPPDLDILGFGTMAPYMMTPGGRSEIGAYPAWEAQYLVHKTPALRRLVLENGNHSGSWSMQVTEADGTSIIRLDKTPAYWLDGRASPEWGPKGPRNPDGSVRGKRPSPADPDPQHVPSVSFIPYLVTGDRWYLDQLKFWANWGMIATYPGESLGNGVDFGRMQSMGLLAQNGTRGFAWPLRELADCAAYLPDSDPDRAYFATALGNNLNWLEKYATTSNGGITEAIFWERNTGVEDPPYAAISLWQGAYLAFAVDRAIQHGFGPAGTAFRNRAIRSQLVFLNSGAQGYPASYGAPYYPRVGEFKDGKIVLYPTMKQVWDANYNPAVTTKPNTEQPWMGYYAPETWLLVTMGVREKIPGADAAYAWLTAYRPATGGTVLADVNHRGGFGMLSVSGPSPSVPAVQVK